MYGVRFLQTAGLAFAVYSLVGWFVAVAMLIVGGLTFTQIDRSREAVDQERRDVVTALRTLGSTFGDAAAATDSFDVSLGGARDSAMAASRLATDNAASFRSLAAAVQVQVFGIQPLAGLAPQFEQTAGQLDDLAVTLANTGTALGQNSADITRVSRDLAVAQRQIDDVAGLVEDIDILAASGQAALLPFKVAYFGMCVLVVLQSLFTFIGGLALLRHARLLRRRARLEGATATPASDLRAAI
jgi:hypothetical protein